MEEGWEEGIEGWREGGTEGGRYGKDRRSEGGSAEGREAGRKGGTEEGRDGGREGGWEGGREGGWVGGREGGKQSPLFIERFNHDSVPQTISGLCRLFRMSMSAAFFLIIWQLIRISIFVIFIVSSIHL